MKSRQIPREEWSKFFKNLSTSQAGCEVALEVFSPEIGNQVEERHMFLSGMTAEVSDRGDVIEIMMARAPGDHLTHIITAPTRVDLQQTDLRIDSAVCIKAADGTTNLLRLS